ncbi:MAG: OprD family outer membrane porin [Candidatus Eremiobacteraeota bacterium]|nr:OprD family outer membrane porin [Candidatus Eremiobacteraeota bacterium]
MRGYLRVYDFTRLNAIKGVKAVNQQSIEPGLSLHADYRFGSSPFSAGASYLYATPFNGCPNPATHLQPPCGGYKPPTTSLNPDDTLPGYALNTLYEAYVQYKDPHLYAKVGDQVINTPWANASDSRLKPVAFQGADVAYTAGGGVSLELMDMTRFESRTNSAFDDKTLLTAVNNLGSNPGLPAYRYFPGGHGVSNGGFQYGRVGFAGQHGLTTNLHLYHFDDIASLTWLDARYTDQGQKSKPYLALQAGRETSTGSALLGQIDAFAFGAQVGANVTKTITLALGYDQIPQHSATVTPPAGTTCSAAHVAGAKAGFSLPYFIGSNAPSCIANANGTTTYLYGGFASPYTDSYATDPLFTTSISQGMADRRAAGNGVKLSAGYTSPDKRLVFVTSRAYYDYGNRLGQQQTSEFDADLQYFANKPRPGAYKGLLFRYRYADREQANTAQYGGAPYFKYNRAQLEYDF